MRWLRALWLVGFVLGGGCLQIDCEPEDRCPGHAVYPNDWNLSECECPLQSQLPSLDGTACVREGLTCVIDNPYSSLSLRCTCVHMPAGERMWQCGAHDMGVPMSRTYDFATIDDDGGFVDGSVSD